MKKDSKILKIKLDCQSNIGYNSSTDTKDLQSRHKGDKFTNGRQEARTIDTPISQSFRSYQGGEKMKPMREATRRKRNLVISIALKMFADQGYENVSVDDIIAEAGISKGTFYHYFQGKDEIVASIVQGQNEVIQAWSARSPLKIKTLEGHINRLFLDLSSNIMKHPKIIRSLFTLAVHHEPVKQTQKQQHRLLYDSLLRWLPDENKVELLVSTYYGTVMLWSLRETDDLVQMMKARLATLWEGLRYHGEPVTLKIDSDQEGEGMLKVAVIGGGLAGLTAAAYLSDSQNMEGVLFERSPQLGGRAFTYEKAGFTLNYGAHAIYGIDRHTISQLERELGLSFSSKQVDRRKVMYAKDEKITEAPLDFVNLMKTELLAPLQKMRFVGEITAIIAQIHKLKQFPTLGDYLAESGADEEVKELWEHLVCSNFFIAPEDARKVPGVAIAEYYQNLFVSGRPVNYILGSWAVITNQLKQKIEGSARWDIRLKEGVEGLRYEDGKYVLQTKSGEQTFDRVIFAMPVQQVAKLLKGTPWEPFLAPYEHNRSTEVMVYDVGLSRIVARPFSYISDMTNKLFISDVSATDHTLVPSGGQLLQGVAYLSDDMIMHEEERKAYLDDRIAKMEQLFDQHYGGWREAIEVKRVSKKAMVQSVKNVVGNELLPTRIDHVPFYFCGDGCVGKGELAERAFSSARSVAQMIRQEARSKP